MIDIRKLKELVRLMVDNDLTELDLRDSEEQVTVRRPNANSAPQVIAAPAHAHYMPPPVVSAPMAAPAAAPAKAAVAAESDAGLHKIESPMVGTFYAAGNPDSPPFVSVGTSLSPDKTVC